MPEQLYDAQGRKLRLNKRLTAGVVFHQVSIPGSTTLKFTGLFSTGTAAERSMLSVPLTQTQSFRIVEAEAFVSDDFDPSTGSLIANEWQIQTVDDTLTITCLSTQSNYNPANPLGFEGLSISSGVSPLVFQTDYLAILGHAMKGIVLDINGTITNTNAAARTLDMGVHAIYEIFDVEPLGGSA